MSKTLEVEKYLFDQMVGYISGLGKFVTAVGSNEIRKASESKAGLLEQREQAKRFIDTLQRKSASPASAASAKAMAGLKSPLRKIIKNLDSILNGIENQELNLTGFREGVKTQIRPHLKELIALGEKFSPSGVTEEELKQQIKVMSLTHGHKSALQLLRNTMKKQGEPDDEEAEEASPEAQENQRSSELLTQYKTETKKLPSSLKGRLFQLVRIPIVPYLESRVLTPSFLRRVGVKFSRIADSFVILDDQYLLAFDAVKATEYAKRKPGHHLASRKSSHALRVRTAKHQSMQEEFVLDFLETLNKTATVKLTLVTSHFEYHPNDGRIAFAWVMPEGTYQAFARAGNISRATWGFPWSREAASVI